MLANKGQALVEFERPEDAENVLLLQQQRQCISISNCVPNITFSTVQSLSSSPNQTAPASTAAPNNRTIAGGSNEPSDLGYHPDEQQQTYYTQDETAGTYGYHNASGDHYTSSSRSNHPYTTKSQVTPYAATRHSSMSSRPDEHYANGGGAMSAESSASSPADRIPRKEGKPNKVLLFTIIKPDYPITVRVLLAVCKKFNCAPVKIYIFRRRGVQAMVEFDDLDTATYVKSNLDGADIYSGCCTLKIEFARPESLNVNRNSEDTYNALLEAGGDAAMSRGPPRVVDPGLLPPPGGNNPAAPENFYHPQRGSAGAPSAPGGHQGMPGSRRGGSLYGSSSSAPGGSSTAGYYRPSGGYYEEGRGNGAYRGRQAAGPVRPNDGYYVPIDELDASGGMYHGGMDGSSMYRGGASPQTAMLPGGGVVPADIMPACFLMYGMNEEKFGPRRLFNLLCIFGNVNKIKFMKTKPGSALVEMQGYESVTRIMQVIKGIECFGSELTPKSSKQQELFERQPDESRMPNGEPFYFNFMGSRDQRFSSALDRAKNRQQTPKKTLHAYNLPKGIPEEAVMKIFEDHDGCPVPEKISFVENKYKEEAKKIGANVVFRSVPEATEALILVNHTLYTDPNERKYTVKLCYSSGRDTE